MKVSLAKNFNIQPSEIDKMAYWEYELFASSLNDMVKKDNESQQKEMEATKEKYGDMNKFNNSYKQPNFKVPSFK